MSTDPATDPIIGGEGVAPADHDSAATEAEADATPHTPPASSDTADQPTEAPAEAEDVYVPEAGLVVDEVAELLREALLAAHDDLSRDDLSGATPEEVRDRYLASRQRLAEEAEAAAEAREAELMAAGSRVPAGAPGRFAPAPATAFEKIREGLVRLDS